MTSDFHSDRSGNVALLFALLSPVLICAAGLAVDIQARIAQKASLQDAADTLALRGARELLLDNTKPGTIENLIVAVANQQFGATLGDFDVTPSVDGRAMTAAVTVAQPSRKSFFMARAIPTEDPIVVGATAQAKGVADVCVITLDGQARGALKGTVSATLDANKCAILSNSTATDGIDVSGLARVTARMICSSGGAAGSLLNYSPAPLTDCPPYADPLAERPAPDASGCDHVDYKVGAPIFGDENLLLATLSAAIGTINGATEGTLTGYDRYDLQPGVYCGGITLGSKADAHFAPGVYVIKDGPLKVDYGARLYARNVGFYLEGAASTFDFRPASIIHMTAPTSGLMAGLLFFESRAAPKDRIHRIESGNARELLGTIYLPRGRLLVNSANPIADSSAYTAIVSNLLELSGTPRLVLNADYGATNVPVPQGLGPTGGQVYLRD